MKKTLLILSLFFAAQGAFSGNNSVLRNSIQAAIAAQSQLSSIVPTTVLIDMSNGYSLALSLVSDGNSCSYTGVLTYQGNIVGSITGSCQYASDGTVIDGSFSDTYSNEETSAVVKPKHDSIKVVVGNVR